MLDKYKEIALKLGITHSPNIGEETLLNKIKDECTKQNINFDSLLENNELIEDKEYIEKVKNISLEDLPEPYDPNDYKKLVRVQITCLDPSKNKNTAEIFTVGNLMYTETKCVPYNVPTHISKMILEKIKDTKYQMFTTKKNPITGDDESSVILTNAYSVVELPPLSVKE